MCRRTRRTRRRRGGDRGAPTRRRPGVQSSIRRRPDMRAWRRVHRLEPRRGAGLGSATRVGAQRAHRRPRCRGHTARCGWPRRPDVDACFARARPRQLGSSSRRAGRSRRQRVRHLGRSDALPRPVGPGATGDRPTDPHRVHAAAGRGRRTRCRPARPIAVCCTARVPPRRRRQRPVGGRVGGTAGRAGAVGDGRAIDRRRRRCNHLGVR